MTIFYFNFGVSNRINAGLIFFDDENCIVKINNDRLKFIKTIKPESYELFEMAVTGFESYYNKNIPTQKEIKRMSAYQNGVFKIDEPKKIELELTTYNFMRYFKLI